MKLWSKKKKNNNKYLHQYYKPVTTIKCYLNQMSNKKINLTLKIITTSAAVVTVAVATSKKILFSTLFNLNSNNNPCLRDKLYHLYPFQLHNNNYHLFYKPKNP